MKGRSVRLKNNVTFIKPSQNLKNLLAYIAAPTHDHNGP